MILSLLAILLTASLDASSESNGTIQGVVVNGSHGNEPIGNADVLLRAGQDGHLEPVARIKTEASGTFIFDHLPLDPKVVYLLGADRDGVHYPGQRIRLDQRNPIRQITIRAFDAVESPSPLEALQHDIDITVDQKVMTIRELLLINNNSGETYVGERVGGKLPVTLRLAIPANFDRVTFGNEFYGRRFRIADHQVLTDIPWPPGERELSFTYRIPLEGSGGLFRRPLDMPCRKMTIRFQGNDSAPVSCNLPLVQKAGDEAVFASNDKQLRAGYAIEAQIGAVAFPWMMCARWGSLLLCVALVLVTAFARRIQANGEAGDQQNQSSRQAA